MADDKHFTCVFCKETFYGYGNNPEPLKSGRCCSDCDALYVIPYRIKLAQESR